MVLIHLAKITTLEESCDYFHNVIIPEKVKLEVIKEEFPETIIIKELIIKNKIQVKSIENKNHLKKAYNLNIFRGEAEVVALAWELNAEAIATDDDNVRKKREIINLEIIGTPAILLTLFEQKKITKEKLYLAIRKMKEIGWFSSTIWDKMKMEVEKNERNHSH